MKKQINKSVHKEIGFAFYNRLMTGPGLDVSNLILIIGVTGRGKSTVARTIGEKLERRNQVGV